MNAIVMFLMVWSLVVPPAAPEESSNDGAQSDREIINALIDNALARNDEPERFDTARRNAERDDDEETASDEPADEPGNEENASAAEPADRAPLSITGVNLSGADVDLQTVGSDTIIITGNERDVAMLEAIIELLDEQGPQKVFRVVTLERAGAKRVAESVEAIYSKLKPRPGDEVTAVAVAPTVVVIAGPEHLIDEALNIAPHTSGYHLPNKPGSFRRKDRYSKISH